MNTITLWFVVGNLFSYKYIVILEKSPHIHKSTAAFGKWLIFYNEGWLWVYHVTLTIFKIHLKLVWAIPSDFSSSDSVAHRAIWVCFANLINLMEFQKRFANVLIIYSVRSLSQREAKRDRWFFFSFHVIWNSIWLKVVSKNADRIWFKCKFCWLFSLNWNKMLPHCADGAHTHTLCWCFMLNVYIVTRTYPRYAKLLAWLHWIRAASVIQFNSISYILSIFFFFSFLSTHRTISVPKKLN